MKRLLRRKSPVYSGEIAEVEFSTGPDQSNESERQAGAEKRNENGRTTGPGSSAVIEQTRGAEQPTEIERVGGSVLVVESETSTGAEVPTASELVGGPDHKAESVSIIGDNGKAAWVETIRLNQKAEGRPQPGDYIDTVTQLIGVLAAQWTDTQQMRRSSAQRQLPDNITEAWKRAELQTGEALKKALREHPLWPWLSQFSGLGGVHSARVIARIRDPRRFPGQQCDQGHTLSPLYEIGEPCPITTADGKEHCPGRMLEPRHTTGVRSLWHYCGLHVDDDGRSPRKQKGVKATWDMMARTSILQPDGIADAIIKNRTPVYRDLYDLTKDRLIARRGVITSKPNTPVEVLFGVDAKTWYDSLRKASSTKADKVIESEVPAGPGDDDLDGAIEIMLSPEGDYIFWGQSDNGAEVSSEIDASIGPDTGDESESKNGADGSTAVENRSGPDRTVESATGNGAEPTVESVISNGPEIDPSMIEVGGTLYKRGTEPLRPIQIHERARKVAAKAFIGDLLMEWKKLVR